jgi:hypothetical protein
LAGFFLSRLLNALTELSFNSTGDAPKRDAVLDRESNLATYHPKSLNHTATLGPTARLLADILYTFGVTPFDVFPVHPSQ